MKEWYLNERRIVLTSQYPQVKAFTIGQSLNIESSTNKALRKWIYMVRKIK